jgi:hypothetical protein
MAEALATAQTPHHQPVLHDLDRPESGMLLCAHVRRRVSERDLNTYACELRFCPR